MLNTHSEHVLQLIQMIHQQARALHAEQAHGNSTRQNGSHGRQDGQIAFCQANAICVSTSFLGC